MKGIFAAFVALALTIQTWAIALPELDVAILTTVGVRYFELASFVYHAS
jgi:hypothetical protein